MALGPPGYQDEARACFRRAAELGDRNPIILQRIANYDFQTGDAADALARCYRVLERVRQFDGIIFSSYQRFGIPQAEVLAHGVPPEPEPVQAYLRFLFMRDDPGPASVAWRWASGLTPAPLTDPLAQAYVGLLWRHTEFAPAVQAWAAYLGPRAGDYPGRNRVFNGSFASEPSNENPLDWRRDPPDGVEIERDGQVHQGGPYSMRTKFGGTQNLDFHGLSQTQPVTPGIYRLRASIRSEGITTDQGVRLRALDPEAPGRLDAATPAITGSSDWQTVELRIEVRPPTRLVRVELARQPSLKFDNKIAGTVWLDAVSLTSAP